MNVLVTGGAGFIGTHLTRRLLQQECRVTVLDNFHPQIHGDRRCLAPDVAGEVELVVGDVRDADCFHRALAGQDVVVHLAAETGTAQSMYEVVRYGDVNVHGTAVLMEYLTKHPGSSIEKVVVASSRAIYGEGKYACPEHGVTYPGTRRASDMKSGRFEPVCPVCDAGCAMRPTGEDSPMRPTSYYGLTKQVQDQMVLMYGEALGLSAYALRYQNVYGPGQSLHNPYTGILAIFSTLARQGRTIRVFEDGLESRDFVHVDDVVEATWQAVRPASHGVESVNIGTGVSTRVIAIAEGIVEAVGSPSSVVVTGEFRTGDIRHNVADCSKAQRLFGYQPRWAFADGLRHFLEWSVGEPITHIEYETSLEELAGGGLLAVADPRP